MKKILFSLFLLSILSGMFSIEAQRPYKQYPKSPKIKKLSGDWMSNNVLASPPNYSSGSWMRDREKPMGHFLQTIPVYYYRDIAIGKHKLFARTATKEVKFRKKNGINIGVMINVKKNKYPRYNQKYTLR
jgi:hypothetical protein